MKIKAVRICDPQLFDIGGHYLNHDIQLVRELLMRGISVSIDARKSCSVECCGIIPSKTFDFDIFQEVGSDPLVWPIENFNYCNQVFLENLSRIPSAEISADQLIYFPNLLQNQLLGVCYWLLRMQPEQRPRVVVMLRWLNHAMDYIKSRKNVELIPLLYRYSGNLLTKIDQRNLICVDTRELKQAYEAIMGIPVLELPNPMDLSDCAEAKDVILDSNEAKRVVVYQGHTSLLRGFHFLPEIVKRAILSGLDVRFKIQIATKGTVAEVQNTLAELFSLAEQNSSVEIVSGDLTREEWCRLLNEADIILLPYSPVFYGHGSSGVFTEAASLAKVVVVSPNTMPARQGRELDLGVVVADEWSGEAMATSLVEAVLHFEELSKKAKAGAENFRSENSAKRLWDKLLME